jgi:hypothetical protein
MVKTEDYQDSGPGKSDVDAVNQERNLELVEADLASARQELAGAEREVEKASERIEAVIEGSKASPPVRSDGTLQWCTERVRSPA